MVAGCDGAGLGPEVCCVVASGTGGFERGISSAINAITTTAAMAYGHFADCVFGVADEACAAAEEVGGGVAGLEVVADFSPRN